MQTSLLLFKYYENLFQKALFAPSLRVWGGDGGWHWKVGRTPQGVLMHSPELKLPDECDVFMAIKLALVLTFKYFFFNLVTISIPLIPYFYSFN